MKAVVTSAVINNRLREVANLKRLIALLIFVAVLACVPVLDLFLRSFAHASCPFAELLASSLARWAEPEKPDRQTSANFPALRCLFARSKMIAIVGLPNQS
jgi:hypothetical protein